MEPFEWLVLGVGFALGALAGSRGKTVMRSTAKGYLTLTEKSREWTANMREDFRDAVEEARYEHEHEAELEHDAGPYPVIEATSQGAEPRKRAPRSSAAHSTDERAGEGLTRSRSRGTTGRRRNETARSEGSDRSQGESEAA